MSRHLIEVYHRFQSCGTVISIFDKFLPIGISEKQNRLLFHSLKVLRPFEPISQPHPEDRTSTPRPYSLIFETN